MIPGDISEGLFVIHNVFTVNWTFWSKLQTSLTYERRNKDSNVQHVHLYSLVNITYTVLLKLTVSKKTEQFFSDNPTTPILSVIHCTLTQTFMPCLNYTTLYFTIFVINFIVWNYITTQLEFLSI